MYTRLGAKTLVLLTLRELNTPVYSVAKFRIYPANTKFGVNMKNLLILWTFSAVVLLPHHALGFRDTKTPSDRSAGLPGPRIIRPALRKIRDSERTPLKDTAFKAAQVSVDKLTGAPRIVTNPNVDFNFRPLGRPTADDFITRIHEFVDAQSRVFKITSQDLRLVSDATIFDDTDQFFKFRVLRSGIEIQDSSLDFRFKKGVLSQIAIQSFSEAPALGRGPRIDTAERAAESLKGQMLQHLKLSYRVDVRNDTYVLVPVDSFAVEAQGEIFIVQIETATGKTFSVTPTKYYLEGFAAGHIYERYWQETAKRVPYPDLKLPYVNGSVTTDASGTFQTGAGNQPTLSGFSGNRVDVDTKTGELAKRNGTMSNGIWQVIFEQNSSASLTDNKEVAQSMIYYHTNRIIHRAKLYIDSPWFNAPLAAHANLASACNAHWDGKSINLYSAGKSGSWDCANTGLISDVIYHEWGHGLDANTGGIEDGAFSEGYGDIVAMLITRSNILGAGFTVDGQFVRDLSPDKVYPQDKGEVHAEGLIIGSTFYDLFTALKAKRGEDAAIQILEKFAFKMIKTASKYTDVYDALLVIDDDDASVANGTPNFCEINLNFADHGLAQRSDRCLLGKLEGVRIKDGGNANGVLEPGESATMSLNLLNNTGETLFNLQAQGLLTNTPNAVRFSDNTASWNTVGNGSTAETSDSFVVEADSTALCGQKLSFQFNLEGNDRKAVHKKDLYIGTLIGKSATFKASGLPAAIKDNAITAVPIEISGSSWSGDTSVHSATLKFTIKHTYIGDLTIWLESPDGKKFDIYKGSGSNDDIDYNEDISNLVNNVHGEGVWKLMVQDAFYQDEGKVMDFQLVAVPGVFKCAPTGAMIF